MIQQKLEMGPVHSFFPGAMKLKLGLLGDEIISVDTEFGFLSRNILEQSIGKSIFDARLKLGRIEPESALIVDELFSDGIEKIIQFNISSRAYWIREVCGRLSELSSTLKYLALMASRLRLKPLIQILLRHREGLLDLSELLTGSRFGYDYIQPGGVRYDLSDGFIERFEKWIIVFRADFERIQAFFYWVSLSTEHLSQVGVINKEGFGKSVKTRLDASLVSSMQLCDELQSLFSKAEKGGAINEKVHEMQPVTHQIQTELHTQRGIWSTEIKVNQKLIIQNIAVETPSDKIILNVEEALKNESIDDLSLILQSLNFLITEIDK